MTQLTSIVYKPTDATQPSYGFLRVPLQQATLIADYGIEGDRKGGNPERNLNIMSHETLQALKERGFSTAPGQMGEQLIVTGLDVNNLAAGTRLQVGPSAVVEVIKPRTGCERFEGHQGQPRTKAAGMMGVMARVVTGGPIQLGDAVQVIDPPTT